MKLTTMARAAVVLCAIGPMGTCMAIAQENRIDTIRSDAPELAKY